METQAPDAASRLILGTIPDTTSSEFRICNNDPIHLTQCFIEEHDSNTSSSAPNEKATLAALECQDQVKALVEALRLAANLANMNTSTYASTLASLPNKEALSTDCDDDSNAAVIQKRLDSLQREWKLEETALPRLVRCIHGFQSRVIQVDSELDRQIHQEHSLRTQLACTEQRVHQLEAAVRKLHKKNQALVGKLDEKKTERKSLLRNVKDYIRQTNKKDEVEEQRVAAQLRAHERLMKLDAILRRDAADTPRVRVSSKDSLDNDEVAALYAMEEDDQSVFSSTSSILSFQSYVTDDGVASLRLSPGIDQQTGEGNKAKVLTFPQGSKVGLQFCTVPNQNKSRSRGKIDESLEDTERKDPSFKMPTFGNPFQKKDRAEHAFLVCGRHGFDSSIRVPPAIGVRLVAVNGETVEHGSWSLNKIRDIVSLDQDFTLTFRVDPAAKHQKERLDEATKLCELKHYSAGDEMPLESSEILEEIELEDDKHNRARMPSWMGGDKKEKLRLDSDGSVEDGSHSNRPRLPSWMKVEKDPGTPSVTVQTPGSTRSSTSLTSSGAPSMKMTMLPAWMIGETTPAVPSTTKKAPSGNTKVVIDTPTEESPTGDQCKQVDNASSATSEHDANAFKNSTSSFGQKKLEIEPDTPSALVQASAEYKASASLSSSETSSVTMSMQPAIHQQLDKDNKEEVLRFPQGSKVGLQFCTVPNQNKSRSRGKIDESLEDTERKDPSFKMPTFGNPFQKKDRAEHAFLVCGRHGFDSSIRVPPAIGVRLVAVNGETVEHGSWSLNKIRDIVSLDQDFTLTFRVDPAAKHQKERLDEATKLCELKHYSAGDEMPLESSEILEEIELEDDKHNRARMPSWMGGDKKEKLRLDSDGSVEDGSHSNRPRLPSWMKVEKDPGTPSVTVQTPGSTRSSTSLTSSGAPSMKMTMLPAWMIGETTPAVPSTTKKAPSGNTKVVIDTPTEESPTGDQCKQVDNASSATSEHDANAFKKSMSSFGQTVVRGFKMS